MLKLIPLICGLVGLLVAYTFFSWVSRVNGKHKADYQTISINNDLFHRDEWLTIIITIIVLSVATGIFVGWFDCILYVYGSAMALFIEFIGSRVVAIGRTELSLAADDTKAFRVSYRTGVAAGLFMTSFGLLALAAIFIPIPTTSNGNIAAVLALNVEVMYEVLTASVLSRIAETIVSVYDSYRSATGLNLVLLNSTTVEVPNA